MNARSTRTILGGLLQLAVVSGVAGVVLGIAGCPAPNAPRADGLDTSQMPPEVRPDYEVFAQRCSKCHTLARPLNSGISDDDYWAKYVARMRRMPGSGISPEDEVKILRFLHYFSEELKKPKKEKSEVEPLGTALAKTPSWRTP